MVELILISQEMDAQACLVVDLEEDLGLNKLKPEHDQRKSVFFRHLELIRFELGFLGELDAEFLVPPPGIPMPVKQSDTDNIRIRSRIRIKYRQNRPNQIKSDKRVMRNKYKSNQIKHVD